MNAAKEQITDVEAIDGPDQRLEIHVVPKGIPGLELRYGREHRIPEMPSPEPREVVAQLGVARELAKQSAGDGWFGG